MATNLITDKTDRIAIIDQEVMQTDRTQQINFRGQLTELPLVRLEVSIPIYRIKNGRTSVEQYRYIKKHKLEATFFQGSEENSSVQSAQDLILLELSKDARASIFSELAHVALQTEPLLITSHGTVLNGNRRLAAMRQLFDDDSHRYSSFSHVDVAVLPKGARERDLELLEAELQLRPETRLEYGWIERRLKLRYQVQDLEIDRNLIKSAYRFKNDKLINIELRQLALAEEYLSDYLNKPFAYEQVGTNEQLFKDLEESLRRGTRGLEWEARRDLGFLFAKESRNLGARVYGFKSLFDRDFPKFAEKFARIEGIEITPVDQSVQKVEDPADPLASLPENAQATKEFDYSKIRAKLREQASTAAVGRTIADIAAEIRSEADEKSSGEAALKSARRINAMLQEIDVSTADSSTLAGIAAQLATAINRAQSLKSEAEQIMSATGGSVQ